MMYYTIWKNNIADNELLIEVYNKADVLKAQKEFVNKGYVIEEYWETRDSAFIRCFEVTEL